MVATKNSIDLNGLQESFFALAEQYMLDVRDIELILIEALVLAYGSEDIELYHRGIIVTVAGKSKFHNIRSSVFREVMAYFDATCNQRSAKKIANYVESLLAKSNYIVYGKILYRDEYGYEFQPMFSKHEVLRHIEPIYVERIDGTIIPEHIQMLPIELRAASRQFNTQNHTLTYKASYLNKNLCILHLEKVLNDLKESFNIYVTLKVMHYHDGTLYLKDVSQERKMHYKIMNAILNYFRQFGVKVVIKTTLIRK